MRCLLITYVKHARVLVRDTHKTVETPQDECVEQGGRQVLKTCQV